MFRSETRSRKRSNLMVFLRPTVMRDQASSDKISLDRYDYIRGQQQISQPPQSPILRINEAPILPPIGVGDEGEPVVVEEELLGARVQLDPARATIEAALRLRDRVLGEVEVVQPRDRLGRRLLVRQAGAPAALSKRTHCCAP